MVVRHFIRNKRNSFTVKNDQQKMDDNGIVRFTDLRFPQGTKLRPAQLRFAVEVQYVKHDGSIAKELLESNPTAPFVVMTNENQWEVSEATLLKHDLFSGSSHETSWYRVSFDFISLDCGTVYSLSFINFFPCLGFLPSFS
jgi:hypothetical protein